MIKKLLIVGIALISTACVPVPAKPSAASEQGQSTEQLADCPGGYIDLLPGQKASDPTLSSLPGYIDIVGAASSLEGDTLTAIFELREIPEELTFNREDVRDLHLEYMWTVSVNIEGDSKIASDTTDFTIATFHAASRESADSLAVVLPFKDAVQTMVWKNRTFPEKNETHWLELPVNPRLIVSHKDDTLTLIGRIPGITDSSTILFSTFDILLGQDGVSCRPS